MLAVLFLDLDGFKIINDTKGHTTGDVLLQKVAKRLEDIVHNDGMVSRQGGDEFIILLKQIDAEKTTQVAQRILDEFANPIVIHHQEYFIIKTISSERVY
jgi:diguanylate cyclase (GGDEF)-like protein